MNEMMFLSALVISLVGNLYLLVRNEEVRRVMQAAVDKAERDRAEYVRIPFNQAISLGFGVRHGLYRAKDFKHKAGGPHPATLSAHRRSKL